MFLKKLHPFNFDMFKYFFTNIGSAVINNIQCQGVEDLGALVRLIPRASLIVGSHGHIRISEYILYYKILYYFLL